MITINIKKIIIGIFHLIRIITMLVTTSICAFYAMFISSNWGILITLIIIINFCDWFIASYLPGLYNK